jgi:DNA polymerase III alpha subunit (gram-positive type)
MLQTPNLAILVIDTTGIQKNSDILRVTIVDTQDDIVFDRVVQPVRQPGEANTAYTGITTAQLADAPTLREIWSELQVALSGRYVLAYNWEWLTSRLRENARAFELPSLTIAGECLMERASRYYGVSISLRLADICERIDHVLPSKATAPERAIGQLAFLQAMAQGIATVPIDTTATEDDSRSDLDEPPF